MNALTWTVSGVLAGAVTLVVVALLSLRGRLRDANARLTRLEQRLATVDATSQTALDTARTADALARSAQAGSEQRDPPRVVLEPITGRLVKAVALGAGARRVATRLTRGPRNAPS